MQVSAYSGVPPAPEDPDLVRNGFGALVIGLMLGIGLAFLLEYLHLRGLRSPERSSNSRACPLSARDPTPRLPEQRRGEAGTSTSNTKNSKEHGNGEDVPSTVTCYCVVAAVA